MILGEVLIVDSSEFFGDYLLSRLVELSVKVEKTSNSEDALVRLNEGNFALLIVSDDILPLNLSTFVKIVRSFKDKNELPILGLYKDDNSSISEHIDIGVNDYLYSSHPFPLIYSKIKNELLKTSYQNRLVSMISELESKSLEVLKANKQKVDFLANVSHELRTPLNGINGMLELLSETNLNDKQRQIVKNINYSSTSLIKLINDFLNFSKLEAGKIRINREEIDLIDFITQSLYPLAQIAQAKGLSFDLEMNFRTKGCKALVDRLRITQILNNLISNSIKFTNSGFIKVIIQENIEDKQLHFEVKDSGIGMDQYKADKIFHAYQQENKKTSTQFGGTGLGLSISKQLLELMGGAIGVNSQKGKGTSFYFNIPLDWGGKLNVNCPSVWLDIENTKVKNFYQQVLSFYEVEIIHDEDSLYITDNPSEAKTTLHNEIILISINDFRLAHEVPCTREVLYPGNIVESQKLKNEKEILARSYYTMRALVVDDNKINQDVLKGILENVGFSVTISANGKEAVDICDAQEFDIIFMDFMMPVMDGFESAKIISMNKDKLETPIVGISANLREKEIQKAKKSGMNFFLGKPFKKIKLINILDQVFNDLETNSNDTDLSSVKFDHSALDELKKYEVEDNKGFVKQLIQQYLNSLDENVDEIIEFVKKKNYKDACNRAHSLKGTSYNMGALYFGELLFKVEENMLQEKNIGNEFINLLLDVKQEVKDILSAKI